MTAEDILSDVPDGLAYRATTRLSWFTGRLSPIHDEQKVLAQRWMSELAGVPDVWVAIPTSHLDYRG